MKKDLVFYLGANTPKGFHSIFDYACEKKKRSRTYIIKGGPGTGKSGLMRKVAQLARDDGFETELIICSSDPDSLDGVVIKELNTFLADGTAPHVLEPKYPGAVEEIINLGTFWDSKMLIENDEAIIDLTSRNSALHKRCMRFMCAAKSLSDDIEKIAAECVDTDKVNRYISRLRAKELENIKGKIGMESKRYISAVTPKGINPLYESFEQMCDHILVIDDPYACVSAMMIDKMRRYALGSGYNVISFPCPMSPDSTPEHLIIPDIGLGLFTANHFHNGDFTQSKRIRATRFMDGEKLKESRQRISFTKRAHKELIDEAVSSLVKAKQLHDDLEGHYISAMDFSEFDELAREIYQKILDDTK